MHLFCADDVEFPKKHSKILSDVNHEEEQGAHRAQKFMENCDQITELRNQRKKYGSIADKDLSKFGDACWSYIYIFSS